MKEWLKSTLSFWREFIIYDPSVLMMIFVIIGIIIILVSLFTGKLEIN